MSGEMEEPKKGKGVSGLVFAACLFLGLGIGIGLDYMRLYASCSFHWYGGWLSSYGNLAA